MGDAFLAGSWSGINRAGMGIDLIIVGTSLCTFQEVSLWWMGQCISALISV